MVVLVEAQDARIVAEALAQIDGVEEVMQTRIGPGAKLVETREENS